MSEDERGAAGSRRAALGETAAVVAFGLAALWIIPRQTTSGPVLGLRPALLPELCALAIVAIALIGLGLRLWKPESVASERLAPMWPAALLAAVAAAGILALQFAGSIACGLLIVTLGLAVLRERRMRIVIPTLAGTALALVLVFQVWR
ncbi:MAG: hypothetical protein AB7O44_04045 [Hyphomicrobiaceae bacterium]